MVWADSDVSWKTRRGLPPARCSTSCPFQCRCRNITAHHICSVGSCSCYNNSSHLCGCPASICRPLKSTGIFRERELHLRPTITRTGCPLHLRGKSTVAITGRQGSCKDAAGDGKLLEFANLNALRRRLSCFQAEMRRISEGKSVKEMLQRQASPQNDRCVSITENDSFLGDEARVTSSRGNGLFTKHQSKEHPGRLGDSIDGLRQDDYDKSDNVQECRKSIYRWKEYNCDLHLRRVVELSRKCAAYKLLEDIHQRLTCHMLEYINSVAKGLIGDDKTHYLSFFKRDGPFKLKPLKDGTYSELLDFISRHDKPSRDLLKALDAAEDGLIEEAHHKGYNASEIGDIRTQMAKFFQVGKENGRPDDYYGIPFTDTDMVKEHMHDLKQAASGGKLGLLQDVAKLVKLGCFFSCQQLT